MDSIDPSDQDRFEAHSYHAVFERLRREDPLHYCNSERFGPFWSVTRYEDILRVEKDHRLFSSKRELGGVTIKDDDFSDVMDLGASFITMDRPEHAVHRRIVAPAFTPASMKNLAPQIRQIVIRILDDLPLDADFDWVGLVANELPVRVLALLFGIPEADGKKLLRWSNLFVGADDPDIVESRQVAGEELAGFINYFKELRAQRATCVPGADLMSLLAHGKATREMSERDFLATMSLLLIGGNDTTRNNISGGLWALTENPDQYKKLRRDHALIPSAVSEMLRWVSSIAHMRRTATADCQLRGKQIRAGDKLVLWYVSGNRDEEVYAEPDHFLVERRGPRHLAFGAGIHYCIGSKLAEMQLKILWEELLMRYPVIEARGGAPALVVQLHEWHQELSSQDTGHLISR